MRSSVGSPKHHLFPHLRITRKESTRESVVYLVHRGSKHPSAEDEQLEAPLFGILGLLRFRINFMGPSMQSVLVAAAGLSALRPAPAARPPRNGSLRVRLGIAVHASISTTSATDQDAEGSMNLGPVLVVGCARSLNNGPQHCRVPLFVNSHYATNTLQVCTTYMLQLVACMGGAYEVRGSSLCYHRPTSVFWAGAG